MKKVLVVVLALVMAFAFTACGGSDKDSGDKVKLAVSLSDRSTTADSRSA